jgi:hypothetical protein
MKNNKNKKRNGRKNLRRWPGAKQAGDLVPRNVSGFPISQRTTLYYFEYNLLDTGGATLGYVDFRANGIYDPDVAAGGHQPLGYDQWTTFYNNWIVESATITTTFKANVASENTQICGILLSDDTTTPLEVGELCEQPLARWGITCCNAGSKAFSTIRNHYDVRSFYNIKDPLDNVARLGGTTGGDPTEQAIFRVYFNNSNGGISDTTMQSHTLIEYKVLFSEPKALAAS